jgi:hypothetical protein
MEYIYLVNSHIVILQSSCFISNFGLPQPRYISIHPVLTQFISLKIFHIVLLLLSVRIYHGQFSIFVDNVIYRIL